MKERKAFNLFDLGLKKAGKIQIFDTSSLDADGNIIPFETQMAIVSHCLQTDGTKFQKPFETKGKQLSRFWLDWVQEKKNSIAIDESIVADPSANFNGIYYLDANFS